MGSKSGNLCAFYVILYRFFLKNKEKSLPIIPQDTTFFTTQPSILSPFFLQFLTQFAKIKPAFDSEN